MLTELSDPLDPSRTFTWYFEDGRSVKLTQDQIEWVDVKKRAWKLAKESPKSNGLSLKQGAGSSWSSTPRPLFRRGRHTGDVINIGDRSPSSSVSTG